MDKNEPSLAEFTLKLQREIEDLKTRVAKLEAELGGQDPAEPRVLSVTALHNGAKAVLCNNAKAVGMYLNGELKADASDDQQKS